MQFQYYKRINCTRYFDLYWGVREFANACTNVLLALSGNLSSGEVESRNTRTPLEIRETKLDRANPFGLDDPIEPEHLPRPDPWDSPEARDFDHMRKMFGYLQVCPGLL